MLPTYPTRLAQQMATLPRGAAADLCRALDITRDAYNRWARGNRTPSLSHAIRTVRWLRKEHGVDTSVEALWG